jgi:hypothetical protein
MKRNYLYLAAIILAAVAATSAYSLASAAAANEAREVTRGNAAYAATLAYEDARAALSAGDGNIEDVYRWSCRIREAEVRADAGQAARNHTARMRDLHDTVAQLHETDARGITAATLHAATYFFEMALADNG